MANKNGLNFPQAEFEEYMENMNSEVAKLKEEALQNEIRQAELAALHVKRPVGRPRKPFQLLQAPELQSFSENALLMASHHHPLLQFQLIVQTTM